MLTAKIDTLKNSAVLLTLAAVQFLATQILLATYLSPAFIHATALALCPQPKDLRLQWLLAPAVRHYSEFTKLIQETSPLATILEFDLGCHCRTHHESLSLKQAPDTPSEASHVASLERPSCWPGG